MPGRIRLAALVGTLLLLAACGAPPAAAPSGTPGTAAPALTGPAWTTYHGDAARPGVDRSSPPVGTPRVLWHSAALDGDVHAKPLLVDGHVIIATEGDSLYSLDAGSGGSWR